MKFFELFKNILKEERSIPTGKKTLLLIDLDDAIVRAKSNMKIYRKLPTDKVEVALTPEQYAKEPVTAETKKYYDYRDFRDPKKVFESIVQGRPYINNLKIVDDFYNAGADIGVLTARGCENVIAKAIDSFLKVRDKNGNLIKLNIPRERIHAVNDDDKPYPGNTDAEKKANVMKKYAQIYDYVYLSDDDVKNRKNALSLKKDPSVGKKIRTIDAEKHRGEPGKPAENPEPYVEESVMTQDEIDAEMLYFYDSRKNSGLNMNEIVNQFIKKYPVSRDSAILAYFRAKKRVGLSESVISEMAMKDVNQEIIDCVSDGDYGKALILYFDRIKDQASYAGLASTKDAVKKMLSFGIARTFGALEKKGTIPEGSTVALKSYGNKNLDELASKIDYSNNPDYVAPKRASANIERKRLASYTVDELKERIAEFKKDGWKCNDETPKNGHSKEKGDFFYVNISRPKTVNEDVISEMAVKDATPDIISAINNKDYATALKLYFNKIKDQETYAKKSSIGDKFNHMISYGLSRTFNAIEKKGAISSGSTEALKSFAQKNRNKLVDELGGDSPEEKVEAPKVEKKETKKAEPEVYDDSDSGSLKKIQNRVAKYDKLRKELEDYAFSSSSISPFVVDLKKNGENGVSLTAKKPRLSEFDFDNAYQTKNERYTIPMLSMRKRLIPDFIQKEAEAHFSSDTVRNLKKAETLGKEYVEATKNKAYALYFADILNNIVEGLREFYINHKNDNLSDSELLQDLKTEVDFPYNDFVKLDKWFKTSRMKADEEKSKIENRKPSRAGTSNEFYKVRSEYVNFVNALERALSSDKIYEFLSKPENAAVIRAGLDSTDASMDSKLIKSADVGDLDSGKELLPRLKNIYAKRSDENYEPKYSDIYRKINIELENLKRARSKSTDENLSNSIDIKLSKLGEQIENVFLDRIAALDILSKTANTGILKDYKVATERYKKIKAQYLKSGFDSKKAKNVYDPNSPKYKEYYDPAQDKKEKAESLSAMYKAVYEAIKTNFAEVASRKLQPTLLNVVGKKYTYEEIKKLYDALQKSPNDMINLLGSDGFREKRK